MTRALKRTIGPIAAKARVRSQSRHRSHDAPRTPVTLKTPDLQITLMGSVASQAIYGRRAGPVVALTGNETTTKGCKHWLVSMSGRCRASSRETHRNPVVTLPLPRQRLMLSMRCHVPEGTLLPRRNVVTIYAVFIGLRADCPAHI